MSYMTMKQQIKSHLNFLILNGLDVNELKINADFVRCRALGQVDDRGGLSYKTTQSLLNNGMVGLATWCRCQGGIIKTYKTYGLFEGAEVNEILSLKEQNPPGNAESARKSELFWEYSERTGESDYLRRKGVGYYGIRFRNNAYGRVAVVPLCDRDNKFWSYQLLNSDGTKRVPKNIKISGLFHILQPFVNGQPIGLAESYVVAATYYEAIGLPAVTAISSSNLEPVAIILRNKYPNSRIVVLADNDRHLEVNKGLQAAHLVKERLGNNCIIAAPDFEGFPVGSEYSDWNDLVREKGHLVVRNILTEITRG
jgi:putative DNA primase/helicase